MKRLIVVLLSICVTNVCLGVAAMCEYSSSFYGTGWTTITIEYYAENGDCCHPSAGYGTRTVFTDYGGGVTSWSSTPYTNSDLASMNPNCGTSGNQE